jgi:hypothetical protein
MPASPADVVGNSVEEREPKSPNHLLQPEAVHLGRVVAPVSADLDARFVRVISCRHGFVGRIADRRGGVNAVMHTRLSTPTLRREVETSKDHRLLDIMA